MPPRIQPRQRAAARTHGMDVDHGHAHGQPANLGFVPRQDAAGAQRDVGGGAAHVERNDI